MRVGTYNHNYFKSCIKTIQSNIPKYILPSEQFDYENFLLRNSKRYFIFFKANDLVACGGYGFNKTKKGSIILGSSTQKTSQQRRWNIPN